MGNSLYFYKRFFLVFCILIFLISGCISDYDGTLPESEPIPVMNGVLYSDSLLRLNLSISNHPKEKEFEPINEASFSLKKNNNQISSSFILNEDGTYIFNDTCFNGDNFEIEVKIPGYSTLSSKTTIPRKPNITINAINGKGNQRTSSIFELEIDNIGDEIHAIYIFLFNGELNENEKWEQKGIYCDSPFADSFNRFFDSWAPEGFSYEYEHFVRFPLENLPQKRLQTNLAFIGGSKIARFYILAATKEYDLYYKGGYLQHSFDPKVNLPFTYQPIYLPSNINGGTGIFSGIDLSLFDFRSEQ